MGRAVTGWGARSLGLLYAELFLGIRAQAFRGPGRSPDHIDSGGADSGQLFEAGFDLGADVDVLGTAL